MAESSSPIQASGRSGDSCRQAGPYRAASRTPLIVFFRAGERFPNDAEGRSTSWTLIGMDSRDVPGAELTE
jgi:hypothetical protein